MPFAFPGAKNLQYRGLGASGFGLGFRESGEWTWGSAIGSCSKLQSLVAKGVGHCSCSPKALDCAKAPKGENHNTSFQKHLPFSNFRIQDGTAPELWNLKPAIRESVRQRVRCYSTVKCNILWHSLSRFLSRPLMLRVPFSLLFGFMRGPYHNKGKRVLRNLDIAQHRKDMIREMGRTSVNLEAPTG